MLIEVKVVAPADKAGVAHYKDVDSDGGYVLCCQLCRFTAKREGFIIQVRHMDPKRCQATLVFKDGTAHVLN